MIENPFTVKDSGARQEFETGARRDVQTGKGRFDLIPSLPVRRLAVIYEEGAKKYGENNWQKGIPLSRYLDSAERHLNMLKAGEPTEDHAMQAAWNLFSYVWTLEEIKAGRLPASLDTRARPEPQYEAKPKCASWKGPDARCMRCGVEAFDHEGAPRPKGRGCKGFMTSANGVESRSVCDFCRLPYLWHVEDGLGFIGAPTSVLPVKEEAK